MGTVKVIIPDEHRKVIEEFFDNYFKQMSKEKLLKLYKLMTK
ncbi:hypothetical protein SAMN05880501_10743 [Ureibacillus xyleni]|uniref:Uncharacterized protein n=1 Tax=Ureibacillus xyleni TaxID=614648 RepID=A0A285SVT9_9BACL|nr:hypothetical protein [Ureibacillus xyleni]SOC12731.1 hypothetical protein SAMN05880501_10743 [Ureibacillus xyleni]